MSVLCPGCRLPYYTVAVRDVAANTPQAAKVWHGDWRTVEYADLVSMSVALPQPPPPPHPPVPCFPHASFKLTSSSALFFWQSNTLFILLATVGAAALLFGIGTSSDQIVAPIASWVVLSGFAALIIVPLLRRRAMERVGQEWAQARMAYDQALAVAKASEDTAKRDAESAQSSAFYCHKCGGCFWPHMTIGAPSAPLLSPQQFRAALASAGRYADLPQKYLAAYSMIPTANPATLHQTIGDIIITGDTITTPSCSMPVQGSRWYCTEMNTTSKRVTPVWAIAIAVFFLPLCGLGLLFLKIKETKSVTYLRISVENNGLHYETSLAATNPHERHAIDSHLDHAQLLAITR